MQTVLSLWPYFHVQKVNKKQNKTKQNKTKQNKTKQNKNKTKQELALAGE